MESGSYSDVVSQLRDSGLLNEASASDLGERVPDSGSLAEIAAWLVDNRVLTPFQADLLIQGRISDCVLAERYQLLDQIGAGGMGQVFRAKDTKLERTVAIKVLAPHKVDQPDAVKRFEREASALAKLALPGIVKAFDTGSDANRNYLVMEYVEGDNLGELLRGGQKLEPSLAADYIYQVACSIQDAHERGMIHRDLKPSNLVVTPDHRIMVLDFGLARVIEDHVGDESLTMDSMGLGTPDYMSPEQFRNARHVDHRADIYSLGCTLYRCLSGRVPFPSNSVSEKSDGHQNREPTSLETLNPDSPMGLNTVCRRMMAKRPEDRYRSMRQVSEVLSSFVGGGSPSFESIRDTLTIEYDPQNAPKSRKRVLHILGTLVATLLLTTIALTSYVLRLSNKDGQRDQPSRGAVVRNGAPNGETTQIEEGVLKVAADGTAQFETLRDALQAVQPGETIRIVDNATYQERLTINRASRFQGVTLEATAGATLALDEEIKPTDVGDSMILISNVPDFTLRGFNIKADRQARIVTVRGKVPGTTLESIRVAGNGRPMVAAFNLFNFDAAESPIRIVDCHASLVTYGFVVDGIDQNYRTPAKCNGLRLLNCKTDSCLQGVTLRGFVNNVLVAHCIYMGAQNCGIQLEQILPGSDGIVVANNTMFECSSPIRFWHGYGFESSSADIFNNLAIENRKIEFSYTNTKSAAVLFFAGGGSDGRLGKWNFHHNSAEIASPREPTLFKYLIRANEELDNSYHEEIAVKSKNPDSDDFLALPKDSPFATGGAGEGLPTYLGAVPPASSEAFDWEGALEKLAQREKAEDTSSENSAD